MPQWSFHQAQVVAPAGAAIGVVYLACHEQGSAWFDEYSFRRADVRSPEIR
ncbi:MAG: hypothetical protein ACRELA_15830 [Candidatus Rokuibacteriota bacterium]